MKLREFFFLILPIPRFSASYFSPNLIKILTKCFLTSFFLVLSKNVPLSFLFLFCLLFFVILVAFKLLE